jgi:hypothetical protein
MVVGKAENEDTPFRASGKWNIGKAPCALKVINTCLLFPEL